ncbi:MAG: HIT family protein [Paracoccus sp. (in: a-proteobacteria)]|uniref:HIT family protein n=1 Tax=Paracoccus sp. TaxID=267 RepID=UPI0026E01FC0|nr:HIT family protein [Paracoccus sp. (in: a-proteobacteria)]MDO5632215.1 HIT family protein [Paracoccus sp. (in: a-proteobacteria)]
MTDCLFCRITSGALPAHKVAETDNLVAFLDLHPIRPGHTLVVPRDHHVWFEDMPAPLAAEVMALSQQIARAQKKLYGVERVAMFFTGIHVPHVHAHVVPMHHVHDVSSAAYLADGPDSYSVPVSPASEELAAIARDLGAAV